MLTKNISKLVKNFSIEVMPRTLGKLENIENLWPKKTRVYIAHLEGTTIEDMLVTAKRIKSASFTPMPHFPARIIKDNKVLEDWMIGKINTLIVLPYWSIECRMPIKLHSKVDF